MIKQWEPGLLLLALQKTCCSYCASAYQIIQSVFRYLLAVLSGIDIDIDMDIDISESWLQVNLLSITVLILADLARAYTIM